MCFANIVLNMAIYHIQKYQLDDPKQKEATDSPIKSVAGDSLPFITVESQNFKNFRKS